MKLPRQLMAAVTPMPAPALFISDAAYES